MTARTEYAIIDGFCFRVSFNPDFDTITVSDHAIEKYMSYEGTTKYPKKAKKSILRLLSLSQKAVIDEKTYSQLKQDLKHNALNSTVGYRVKKPWLLVLVDTEVRTVHQNESGRWRLAAGNPRG